MHLLSFLICVIIVILFGKLLNHTDFAMKPQLLCQTVDVVNGGKFLYYYVHFNSHIILNLTSLYGDADIYVSDINMFPSYDPASYTLCSATCGVDVIEMTELLKSPLAIGIYGYADRSYFNLEVFDNPKYNFTGKRWASITLESDPITPKGNNNNGESGDKVIGKNNKQVIKKRHKSSSNAASVFLEILQLIFL